MAFSTILALVACLSGASAYAGAAVRAPVRAAAVRMGVPVVDFEGAAAGDQDVALKVAKAGAYVVHRKVVTEQANMRLGTACTKTRSDVRGGGRKPYQQKGTGNARRGSTRSPLLKGGGVTFGPKPKSYKMKLNKKEARLALSTALMGAVPRMKVVQDFEEKFASARTADMKSFLDRLEVNTKERESTLMITKARDENSYLSARNIPYLNLMTLDNLNARDILRAKKVFVSASAMGELTARYGA